MLPRGRTAKSVTPAQELEYYITMHAHEPRVIGWEVTSSSVAVKAFVTDDGEFIARVSYNKNNVHREKPWVLVVRRPVDGYKPVDTLHENVAEALNAANTFFAPSS